MKLYAIRKKGTDLYENRVYCDIYYSYEPFSEKTFLSPSKDACHSQLEDSQKEQYDLHDELVSLEVVEFELVEVQR